MTAALRRVRGVTYANVDRRRNEATVLRTRGQAPDKDLVKAVHKLGYSASIIPVKSSTLSVNMACVGCPERVRSALRRVSGVRTVALQGKTTAKVEYDCRRANERGLVQACKRAGFTAKPVTTQRRPVRRVVRSTSTATARPVSRQASRP